MNASFGRLPGDPPDGVFRQLFELSPNAVALRDAAGVVLAVNRAFEALFAVEASQAVGKPLLEVVRPYGRDPLPDEDAFGGGGAELLRRTRWAAGDGAAVDAAVSQVPVRLPGEAAGAFVIFRDIAGRKRAEEKLSAAERKYRSIFENAVEGIFQTTPEGRYLEVNPTLAKIYGFASPAEMMEHFRDIKNQLYVDPERRDAFVRIMGRRGEVWNFESAIRKKDGTVIWISENARAVRGDAGGIAYYEGTVVDVTARKRAEEGLARERAYFSQLFANSPQGIVLIDTQRNVIDANQGFADLFGYRAEDIKGFGVRSFIVPESLLPECENLRSIILTGKAVQRETVRRHRDGRDIPVSMIGFPVAIGGAIRAVVYIYQDISERKAFEEQITHQAFHDALTGLPNRSLFAERLERALARARRSGESRFAVLMIDLDKFKAVNDSLGHQAGDKLLVEAAGRLSGCVRSVDTVARLGGDEFAVILEEFRTQKEVMAVVGRIRAELGRPVALGGTEVVTPASVGIVLGSGEYGAAEDILRDADIAMYRAKERGTGCLVFDRAMHREILETMSLEAELREAVGKGELVLHYQPIVSVGTGAIEGFEALVRWDHPTRGLVPPARFIPLAEETGIILAIGHFVIDEACRQLKAWQEAIPGTDGLTVSVNVSLRQFTKNGLVEHVARVLADTGLDPACLKLEITESVLMHDAKRTARELSRLKALGVAIAIDDFGTGYSSLSYLRELPIDHLKIDRSFISGPGNVEESDKIVTSIITLAGSLGITVIAEGVEREDQLERLRGACCDQAQGYMFSRPVAAEAAMELLSSLRDGGAALP